MSVPTALQARVDDAVSKAIKDIETAPTNDRGNKRVGEYRIAGVYLRAVYQDPETEKWVRLFLHIESDPVTFGAAVLVELAKRTGKVWTGNLVRVEIKKLDASFTVAQAEAYLRHKEQTEARELFRSTEAALAKDEKQEPASVVRVVAMPRGSKAYSVNLEKARVEVDTEEKPA
jgi:hypothetical protein